MTTQPSFFIVGAPKAGTTSLNEYLAQFPDIYIPTAKEMHFFGTDLRQKKRESSALTLDGYLSHFLEMDNAEIAGEASVLYLKSQTAAKEIHSFCPNAKIIVMLRQPADLLHSLHAQLVSQGDEDEVDFAKALRLESDRRSGRNLPKGILVPDDGLFYREVAQLGSQLARYMDVFPKDKIHIIFFEDFVANPTIAVANVRKFLGLEPSTTPIDTTVRNPASRPRSRLLTRFLYHPPRWSIRLAKQIAPRAALIAIRDKVREFNNVPQRPKELSFELRKTLTQEFEPEIEKLEALTGRDLTEWRYAECKKPLQVSVVIPCYNCATTIENAVRSVLNQTAPVAEIILVNDGSTDNTAEVLRRLSSAHELVKTITLHHNAGPSTARNTGWDNSNGEWVAFLDSDDAWHPRKVEIQTRAILMFPGLSIIGHGCEVGSLNQDWSDLSTVEDSFIANRTQTVGKFRLIASNPWPTPSVMIRRTITQRFDPDMRRAEDYLLWSRIVMGGGTGVRINLNLVRLYKAKFGDAGLSANLHASEVAELDAIRRLQRAKLINPVQAYGWQIYSFIKYVRRLVRHL
mgnify:CR=1 FL=1